MGHIVWDWNGTLFNDLHLLAEATSDTLRSVGHEPIDIDTYRRHFTRPLSAFYESLTGRELSDDEWSTMDRAFDKSYESIIHRAELAEDALVALELARDAGYTQSILSMWHHHHLVPFVEKLGVKDFFIRVDGNPDASPHGKSEFMAKHLDALNADTNHTIVIGDTVDDGVAARDNGVRAVLVSTGAQLPDTLEAVGFPVVTCLTEALEVARTQTPG